MLALDFAKGATHQHYPLWQVEQLRFTPPVVVFRRQSDFPSQVTRRFVTRHSPTRGIMADQNPILNNPYEVPARHYSTNLAGELDYSKPIDGRRVFVPIVQSVPVRQSQQQDILEINEVAGPAFGTHIVNLLRREVELWRLANYPQTTRITRELLAFWFLNPNRDQTQRLFFAQREAIETAIWLNEVAEKSNPGQHILRVLEEAQKESLGLPRIGFKMATGTGKTVVMAGLIAYHYFNRAEYRNDTRYADNFLIVTPGITIRDRLGVLRVDVRNTEAPTDYYHVRFLIPPAWRQDLTQLNSKLVITNYHAFEPKTLQGNKRSPTDGKIGPDGKKQEAREDHGQTIARLLGSFRGSRLLVINDEAHHCYFPREDARKAEGEDADGENKRAAVWFSGVKQITERFKVRSVYDLSATPYYLTGSGYEPYKLFPWVVSDFGLIEAIESGLVKIPFLPTWDDTQELEMPVLRNLYDHVKKEGLPKAGQRTERARAKAEGKQLIESPPQLPHKLKLALKKFYDHYEEEFQNRAHSLGARGEQQLELADTPPVFILVCNNTSVSKEVFKYIAGYEKSPATETERAEVVPGILDLFTNFDPATFRAHDKPRTILIDSDALENSGVVNDDFKRVFAPEITRFKRDYARVHGQVAAQQLTEVEILREVVNTVGKRGMLGANIRCIVSVSMLTEGWDANTVTHIVGLRAFGSQLLCEQVAGRALRRRSYYLAPYDEATGEQLPQDTRRTKGVLWKFPPEYAHIIGVPFKFFKGGKTVITPPRDLTPVQALPERAEKAEITFANVVGYRVDYPAGPLRWNIDKLTDFPFDAASIPLNTKMASAFSATEEILTVNDVLAMRDQAVIYGIARVLLRDHFSDEQGNIEFSRFLELKDLVTAWYERKVRVLGRDPVWKKLLWFDKPERMAAHVSKALPTAKTADGQERTRAITNYYNPTGSTRFVHGNTSQQTYPTRHSHINVVVLDSGWEGRVAKVLDDLAEEGLLQTWVKNHFLDFKIPYTKATGEEANYVPDFIVRANRTGAEPLQLIVEVTGMKLDKPEKIWSVENRWLPAVNAARAQHRWPRWDFVELDAATEIADARNRILAKLQQGN